MSADPFAQAVDAIATRLERGDAAGAERVAQDALQRLPPHAELWRLLAIAQLRQQRGEAALRSLGEAARLDPRSVEVLCNLATVQTMAGQAAAAQASLERALAIAPDHPAALAALGRLLHARGDYVGAARVFERALPHGHPVEARVNLANARIALAQWDAAEALIRDALQADTQSADAWYLAGFLFERTQRLAQACTAYETSLKLRSNAQAAHNLGLVYDQLGRWQDAARLFETALRLQPALVESLSHLVFAKRRLCDWHGLDALSARLQSAVAAGAPGVTPFSFLAEPATPQAQLACARRFARGLVVPDVRLPAAPERPTGAPLRIGFVSSGLRQHATGLLIVELVEQLRAQPLQTIAISTMPGDGTPLRARLKRAFDEFHDVAGRGVAEIAAHCRALGLDVLLDIDGYCMDSLPQLFALRPAPVQVNWLAYPGSMGAPWYDWIIADHSLIDAATRDAYDEKIAWLPRCYQPTDTTRALPAPMPRDRAGLPREAVVFCCFNATWKLSPARFALWMRILERVPGSVLWLLDGPAESGVATRLRAAAQAQGIDPARLVFHAKMAHAEYLSALRAADLFLDTDPYNAHTTASDALYAGLPVLTCPGATFASRVAASLNAQIGLAELNAASDADYVATAVALAGDATRRDALRARLSDPATRVRLFDMQAYAHDFAALLARLHAHAQTGAAPQDLAL